MATKTQTEMEKILEKLDSMATKDDIKSMASKDDIKAMATKEDIKGLSAVINKIKSDYQGLNSTIINTKRELTEQIRKVSNDLSTGLAGVKDDLATEMQGVNSQSEGFAERLLVIEQRQQERDHFDFRYTVVIRGLPYEADEDPLEKAKDVIHRGIGLNDLPVLRAIRLGAKPLQGRHGIIKAELNTETNMKKVVESSKALKHTSDFKKVYVNRSRNEVEMVSQGNMRTLLSIIPGGDKYTVTWNGRVVEKRDPVRTDVDASGSAGTGRRGGYSGRGGYGRGALNNLGFGRTGPGFDRTANDEVSVDLGNASEFPPLGNEQRNTGGTAIGNSN